MGKPYTVYEVYNPRWKESLLIVELSEAAALRRASIIARRTGLMPARLKIDAHPGSLDYLPARRSPYYQHLTKRRVLR